MIGGEIQSSPLLSIEVEICLAPTVAHSTGFCTCWWHRRTSATLAAKLHMSQVYIKIPAHLLPGQHLVLVLHTKPEQGQPSTTFKTPRCLPKPHLPLHQFLPSKSSNSQKREDLEVPDLGGFTTRTLGQPSSSHEHINTGTQPTPSADSHNSLGAFCSPFFPGIP